MNVSFHKRSVDRQPVVSSFAEIFVRANAKCADEIAVHVKSSFGKALVAQTERLSNKWLQWKQNRSNPDVIGHAGMLPILVRQLEAAREDMETHTEAVCRNFQGMAAQAVRSVREASRALDSGTAGSNVTAVVQGCRETMLALLSRMERSESLSRAAITRMEQIESSVRDVTRTLDELDRSAFSNRLVAINAKVEAAHVGEAARGFEVVAEEISHQADESNRLTCKVAGILGRLVDDARTAISELRSVTAADHEWVEASRAEVQRMLGAVETADGELRCSLAAASAGSRQLATEIEQALVMLQFQDRVSQRINHVKDSLEEMQRSAVSDLKDHSPSPAMASQLEASYTMDCERRIHAREDTPSARTVQEPEIELF
jgi:methyl-accepting chemotaxis protein